MSNAEIDKLLSKYPAPRTGKTFCRMWNILLPDVAARSNFKVGHMANLEILCSLYQDEENFSSTLEVTGRSFQTQSAKEGLVVKLYPEVHLLKLCRDQITTYSKILGLLLEKDKGSSDLTADGKEKGEWD